MGETTLQVTRIAHTQMAYDAYGWSVEQWLPVISEGSSPGVLSEFAGRACYQSWDRPNPKTSRTEDYIAHIIDVGHFSVLAHASVTYYITGVSRSLTHELVRHRWPAFSQLSQRYVRIDDELDYVVPPLGRDDADAEGIFEAAADAARRFYLDLVEHFTAKYPEAPPKLIREAARAVLPNMTETKIVVSANLRAWRDLLVQRLPVTADAEIRELANVLLCDLKCYAPEVFADIEVTG